MEHRELWLGCFFFSPSASFSRQCRRLARSRRSNQSTSTPPTPKRLQQVPGIGPATAEKILQMRKSYGAFKSVDDLLAIRGLGAKRLEKMRKYLTVGKPAPKSNALPNHMPG